MSNELEELLHGAREVGVNLTEQRAAALIRYLEVLDRTNRSFNLTRIPRQEYVNLHLLDSLVALTALDEMPLASIIDIGTGAGFPGVPIAAALPESRITLLDSTAKKVRFAYETALECGITNCVGLHARAELLARDPKHRERYDVSISRAVASFGALMELMLPLTRVGGTAVALKGSNYQEELQGSERIVKEFGGSTVHVHPVRLPGSHIERFLLVVKKVRSATLDRRRGSR